MAALINRLSDAFGILAAWLFFAIGLMITYEVVVRYVFVAPTIWTQEISQFLQIWATFLAAAYVLRHRQLIAIDFLNTRLPPRWRRVSNLFSLAVIAVFSLTAIWYGIDILAESIIQGRRTSTMLSVPNWMSESAVPIGFALLLAQCAVEAARELRGGEGAEGGEEGGEEGGGGKDPGSGTG